MNKFTVSSLVPVFLFMLLAVPQFAVALEDDVVQAEVAEDAQAVEATDTAAVEEAILLSETMDSEEQKVSYLVEVGNQFAENGQFLYAQDVAEYILSNLDQGSEEAQELLRLSQEKVGGDPLSKGDSIDAQL